MWLQILPNSTSSWRYLCAFLSVATFAPNAALCGADIDFVKQVRPIFERHCLKCHSGPAAKAGFRLDVKSAALKGGENYGAAILAGDLSSPLLKVVAGEELRMPPEGELIPVADRDLLTQWIAAGAHWPEGVDSGTIADPSRHWSFLPLRQVEPPAASAGARQGLDLFIAARLGGAGLAPAAIADRRTLARRAGYTLLGLPLPHERVAEFVADARPDAYERLVDELLASPHYGERWARHWLDVVAFGETDGFEVNTPRNNAWPYRDYVIRAFNADLPWAQFIKDQLAGDTTGEDAATGFLVAKAALLPGQTGRDEESQALARQDELAEMVLNTGGALMGLTINCARCHDHKFDPITQRDFYALTGIFAGVRHGERPMRTDDETKRRERAEEIRIELAQLDRDLQELQPLAVVSENAVPVRRPAVSPRLNVERFPPQLARRLRFTVLGTNNLEPCIDELEVFTAEPVPRNVALASFGTRPTASGTYPNSEIHRLEHINDGRYGNGRSWISHEFGGGWVVLEFPEPVTIDRIVWARDRELRYQDRLATQYRIEIAGDDGLWKTVATAADRQPFVQGRETSLDDLLNLVPADQAQQWRGLVARRDFLAKRFQQLSVQPLAYAGQFTEPHPTFLLHRGDPMQKRDPVAPGFLSAFGGIGPLSAATPDQARRVALAEWISRPDHPLTHRVIVNRVWQQQFGEGLVSTPSDLGMNGAQPSHPELLDWLASEFIAREGSVKSLQRLMVTSATFCQSSAPRAECLAVDAQNRLLWRFAPRRLDAEAIRDTFLAVCGTLDDRMGGPGYSVFAPNENYVRVYDPKQNYGPAEWRRMIYQTKVRVAQDSTFGAFDCPDASQNQPRRPRSTTPIQALNLFNSDFVRQQASLFAESLEGEVPGNTTVRVDRAFLRAVGRLPGEQERAEATALVDSLGLSTLCRVLLNTNEILFLE